MDTTTSLSNSQCSPRSSCRSNGSTAAMTSPRKKTLLLGSSDYSSSSSESSVEISKASAKLPRISNHSPRRGNNSPTPRGSKRSSLKAFLRAPPPEVHSEEGGVLKDYYYNENNVLVPRIKLESSAVSTVSSDADDDISVASSVSLRRARRGGRRTGNEGDEGSVQTGDSPKRIQRKGKKFSFWDSDTESSGSEAEATNQSPSKVALPRSPRKLAMAATPMRISTTSRDSSTGTSNNFAGQKKEPVRRAPGRNDSGWHTSGSFSESEDDAQEKRKPRSDLAKLSQAALRMSRSDKPSFSFSKSTANMDNFSSHHRRTNVADLEDHDNDNDHGEDLEDSNHSSTSKNSSYVSAGGWSTGKDSSSSSEDDERRRSPPIAAKKSSSKVSSTARRKHPIDAMLDKDCSPLADLDSPPKGSNLDIHPKHSKFSFLSKNGKSAEKKEASRLISTDSGVSLHNSEQDMSGTVEFDLSAMEFETDGIFEDEPVSPAKRKDTVVVNVERAPSSPKKSKTHPGSTKKDAVKDSKTHEEKRHGTETSRTKNKVKKNKLEVTGIKPRKKQTVTETSAPVSEKTESKAKDDQKETTTTAAASSFLEKRRQERAKRMEKVKERIRKQEEEKKRQEKAEKEAAKEIKPEPLSKQERLEHAYQWYTRCGMPTKAKMKKRIQAIDGCEITVDDVDLLPWIIGDKMVNVAVMNRIIAGR